MIQNETRTSEQLDFKKLEEFPTPDRAVQDDIVIRFERHGSSKETSKEATPAEIDKFHREWVMERISPENIVSMLKSKSTEIELPPKESIQTVLRGYENYAQIQKIITVLSYSSEFYFDLAHRTDNLQGFLHEEDFPPVYYRDENDFRTRTYFRDVLDRYEDPSSMEKRVQNFLERVEQKGGTSQREEYEKSLRVLMHLKYGEGVTYWDQFKLLTQEDTLHKDELRAKYKEEERAQRKAERDADANRRTAAQAERNAQAAREAQQGRTSGGFSSTNDSWSGSYDTWFRGAYGSGGAPRREAPSSSANRTAPEVSARETPPYSTKLHPEGTFEKTVDTISPSISNKRGRALVEEDFRLQTPLLEKLAKEGKVAFRLEDRTSYTFVSIEDNPSITEVEAERVLRNLGAEMIKVDPTLGEDISSFRRRIMFVCNPTDAKGTVSEGSFATKNALYTPLVANIRDDGYYRTLMKH